MMEEAVFSLPTLFRGKNGTVKLLSMIITISYLRLYSLGQTGDRAAFGPGRGGGGR